MSSLGYKKLKSSKSSSSDSNDNGEININILNNDCLIRIFEELSFEDRLKVEMVCKRWNGVGKLSWCNAKTLIITKRFKSSLEPYSKKAATNFYTNIIKRCGIYLTDVCIRNDSEKNNLAILKTISQHCKSLNKFNLDNEFVNKFPIDKHLSKLFKENANLCSISLKGGMRHMNLQSMDCLLSLSLDKITELSLEFSNTDNIHCENFSSNFFSKIINLKKLYLVIDNEGNCNKMLIAFEKSNYQGLEDLVLRFRMPTIYSDFPNFLYNLMNFVFKQKNLIKLKIAEIKVNEDFFKSLKIDLIEEFNISFVDGIPSNISNLKNLISLNCRILELTDECLKSLIKCSNLKKIILSTRKNSLTIEGENNFSKLKKLETFKYYCSNEFRIDPVLKALSSCENLKNLSIEECFISDIGVNSICLMKKLITLSISSVNVTNNQIIKIISELKILNKISVNECDNLTHDLIKALNDVKINRGDKNVLKVYIDHDSEFTGNLIQNREFIKNLKLISLRFNRYDVDSIFDC